MIEFRGTTTDDMKYLKVIMLILLFTMLIQYLYFGLEDCDKCRFNGMGIKEFFNKYVDSCLKTITLEELDMEGIMRDRMYNDSEFIDSLPYSGEMNNNG